MSDGDPGDQTWEALVSAMLTLGPVHERRSRYGDKPALYVHSREVAHREGPGLIDLRLTAAGWGKVKAIFAADEAIERTPTRRDWVALRIQSPADVERLRPLLSAAVEGNR